MWLYYEPYRTSQAVLPGVYGCEEQGHEDAWEHNALRDTNDRIIID